MANVHAASPTTGMTVVHSELFKHFDAASITLATIPVLLLFYTPLLGCCTAGLVFIVFCIMD
jgi:hypothetical protein